jgi:hypothetical protein
MLANSSSHTADTITSPARETAPPRRRPYMIAARPGLHVEGAAAVHPAALDAPDQRLPAPASATVSMCAFSSSDRPLRCRAPPRPRSAASAPRPRCTSSPSACSHAATNRRDRRLAGTVRHEARVDGVDRDQIGQQLVRLVHAGATLS